MAGAPTVISQGNQPAAYSPVFSTVQNPQSQQLAVNPQLVTHPLGAYTDALYESQEAELRATTLRSYNDLLQKLGYLDPDTGEFIRGSIETEAQAEEMRQAYGLEIARQGVTDAMQKQGTLFAGIRGTQQARAEDPYIEAIAALKSSVPQQLSAAYRASLQSLEDYRIGQMKLLADAATRDTTSLENNPPAATPDATDTTGTTTPTTTPATTSDQYPGATTAPGVNTGFLGLSQPPTGAKVVKPKPLGKVSGR